VDAQAKQDVPQIKPMRRGRPVTAAQGQTIPKPIPSPTRNAGDDPFAALDSTDKSARAMAVDELSTKFPSLDDFSLLQNNGSKFKFNTSSQNAASEQLSQRVTNALADDAFATPAVATSEPGSRARSPHSVVIPTALGKANPPERPHVQPPQQVPHAQQATPKRPAMVSTGTMTSRPPSPRAATLATLSPNVDDRPIFRIPPSESPRFSLSRFNPSRKLTPGDSLTSISDRKDQAYPKSAVSSRPSLESLRPPLFGSIESIHRSRSANAGSRPSEQYVQAHFASLRKRSKSRPKSSGKTQNREGTEPLVFVASESAIDDSNISSNTEFLRAMEDEDASKGHHRRTSSTLKHIKHASMPSISLTGTKSILSGRLGEAFRRFEGNGFNQRPPSPDSAPGSEAGMLSPITGSERTDTPSVLDDDTIEETEDLPPAMRRELERRRLSQEEKRVAEGAAAYRQRIATAGANGGRGYVGGPNKASAIQDRVKNLLDESGTASPVKKTAEGYGRFTEVDDTSRNSYQKKFLPRISNEEATTRSTPYMPPPSGPMNLSSEHAQSPGQRVPAWKAPVPAPSGSTSARPNAPPKPIALRTGAGTGIPSRVT